MTMHASTNGVFITGKERKNKQKDEYRRQAKEKQATNYRGLKLSAGTNLVQCLMRLLELTVC